jgi:tRNA uridine 5-carboxymethylaminomethyl modification enzyme
VVDVAASPRLGPELEAGLRYRGYVERERIRLGQEADAALEGIEFGRVPGLKSEAVERLTAARPATLSEARALRGITPADVDALAVWSRKVRSDSRAERLPGRSGEQAGGGFT